MTSNSATLTGFGAVLLWALLALLTIGTTPMPPFQLAAVSFSIGGGCGLVWIAVSGQRFRSLLNINWKIWLMGVAGLFGYHFFYFTALRNAPAAEASLIAYLWPLLIVLFSGLLPGERLRLPHIAGALIAFGGAALVIAGGPAGLGAGNILGYSAALACAFIWSGYSVLSRRAGRTPTASVAGFCLASAALATVAHLIFEETIWPADPVGWISVVLLGLGPVGLAFYLWDVGVKHGNIQLLGVASYAAPLLSTLVLVVTGFAPVKSSLLVAALLIATGAYLASRAAPSDR